MKNYSKSLVSSGLKFLLFSAQTVWVFAFLCISVCGSAGCALHVDVTAKGAVLMNADTGAVLWEKNAHAQMYPASTTKLITALYAMEKKGNALDEPVAISYEAVAAVQPHVRRGSSTQPPYRLEFGGSNMGLQVGEVMSLRSLMDGLLLVSGNDAANVIAQHVSGDISLFIEELNRFVRSKGCKDTILYTPHGLPHEGHKTTAYDLAVLARSFLENPVLMQIVSERQAIRPQTNKQPESLLTQHNALLKPGKFYYPKARGIKTGYTLAAGYCIVTAAQDENRNLIAVLLGCEQLDQRYQDAIALFEAAFNEKKGARTLFSKGFDRFTCQPEGAAAPLQANLEQDLVLEYYPSEEPMFKTEVVWDALSFPIEAGCRVGQLRALSSQGAVLVEAPLYAMNTVEATWNHRVFLGWQRVKMTLWDHAALIMAFCGILVLAGTGYLSYRPRRKKK